MVLATGCRDSIVTLWDPLTGSSIGKPLQHNGAANSLAFQEGQNGRRLLITGDSAGEVQVWDIDTGSKLVGFRRRTKVSAVAQHEDLLAIADGEGLTVIQTQSDFWT